MKIYKLRLENKTLGVHPIDDYYKNPKYNSLEKGTKKRYFKEEFHYELVGGDGKYYDEFREEYPQKYKLPNITKNGGLFFDEKSLEIMKDIFDENIEFFPSSNNIKKYFYINIMDGLENSWDRERTSFEILRPEPFKVLDFSSNINFNINIVKNRHIFKINEKYSFTYVSDTFKKKYEENQLIGLKFELVWDSEELTDTLEERI